MLDASERRVTVVARRLACVASVATMVGSDQAGCAEPGEVDDATEDTVHVNFKQVNEKDDRSTLSCEMTPDHGALLELAEDDGSMSKVADARRYCLRRPGGALERCDRAGRFGPGR